MMEDPRFYLRPMKNVRTAPFRRSARGAERFEPGFRQRRTALGAGERTRKARAASLSSQRARGVTDIHERVTRGAREGGACLLDGLGHRSADEDPHLCLR